jgi:hypothetical protein
MGWHLDQQHETAWRVTVDSFGTYGANKSEALQGFRAYLVMLLEKLDATLKPPVTKGQVWRLLRLPESGNPDVGYLEWHKDMREHVCEPLP